MSQSPKLPSYAELFGKLDFKKGDEARSVYSPAAYLADLLQLLQDTFDDSAVPYFADAERRPDIQDIALDAENTFTEIPYLDIVNEVLARAASNNHNGQQPAADAQAVFNELKAAGFPFLMPFDLDNEKVKKYLSYLEVSAEQIYKQFALEPDSNIVAREYLGLSETEYRLVTARAEAEADIKAFYQLAADKPWTHITNVETFLKTTNLSGSGLRELLFQSLSESAVDSAGQPERTRAATFFINNGLVPNRPGGYVTLAPDEETLVWSDGSAPIPAQWFERVSRFVRLANKSGLAFSDLDLILRSCCNNQLDDGAIRTIAVVKQLHDRYELPVDVACSFFSPLNSLGIGDEAAPQDLFNRTFNMRFAGVEKKYIAGSSFIPASFARAPYAPLACAGDLLSLENKEYRRRLCKALGLSDRDLNLIVTQFRQKYAAGQGAGKLAAEAELGVDALSLLYRIAKLAEVLEISYQELFGLLDLLEHDPSIRGDDSFDPLIGSQTQARDFYQVLEAGASPEALWLVQMLFAVAQWMQANDFTSAELNQILSGRAPAGAEASQRSQKIATLDNLYQQFKPAMLTAELFASDRFSARASRVIHRVLTEQGGGLACEQDRRLVRFDADLAAAVAYQALDQLAVIGKEDFQQLGLEQKLLDKIVANLIFRGYLTPENIVVETALPKQAAEFTLTGDFSAYAEPLFTLIHGLHADAARTEAIEPGEQQGDEPAGDEWADDAQADDQPAGDEPAGDEWADDAQADDQPADDAMAGDEPDADETGDLEPDARMAGQDQVELSLYPSDLEALEALSEAERDELYDNLIFNGYIDADGRVLQADFFALPENVADFKVNADLSAVAAGVFGHIMQQIGRFDATPLALDSTIFEELGLSAGEIDDLVENLRFNEYIDKASLFANKRAMLELPVGQFQLSLAFYPQQLKILTAIKAQINAFRADFYTVAQESLSAIADAAVAQQVIDRLAADYLSNGRIIQERKAFFLDPDNLADFALGADIGAGEHALVFNQIASILLERQTYELPLQALADLGFDAGETAELLEALMAGGSLTEDRLLPEHRIAYFLNVNSALEFSIPAFADYNKDIFFLLHTLAKESADAIGEIAAKINSQAESQARVVFDVLQDALGVEADLVQVACLYLLRGLDRAVEAFMLPILATVGINDIVAAEPNNNRFNLLYKRLSQFALLAAKLRLSPAEAAIAFRDQDLVEKFPEKLALPAGVDGIDALLEDPAGLIYLFRGNRYWAYSAQDYHLLEPAGHALAELSDRFAALDRIDAAFADGNGACYIVAGDACFVKQKGSTRWVKKARAWGRIKNNFENPIRIDTAFQDQEGKTYLFSGTQYIRYSSADTARAGEDHPIYAKVDEGYPLTIADNWEKEGLNGLLPGPFKESIDASFQGTDGKTYLFKNDQYVSSDALAGPIEISATWGRVRNNFRGLSRLDAAYTDGADYYLFADDQVVAYQDSLENDGVCVREGYPQLIEAHFANLPAEFERGLEAAFKGADGQVYFFKDGKTVAWRSGEVALETAPTRERWGRVTNTIAQTGKVDAAFVGLDGKTYLFSAHQYVRYSGADYTQVDEGYPHTIAPDWGGLQTVDAAFVLDGKTYLFGADAKGQSLYVRYSTDDYSAQDEGYPKAPDDNWWNLPIALVQKGGPFEGIDAVFTGKDNRTYLFSGDQFIAFDNKHRWWSEPQSLPTQWDSIPFEGVDAGFVGKDGKTYIFYGRQYIRYSNSNYSKIDDRYPKDIALYWGNVVNNIAKTGRVDAALVVDSTITYLFSGNQYVRYSGDTYTIEENGELKPKPVDNGYPKYIATSLKTEPRFANLGAGFENGIDAAFADRRNIYLFKGAQCHVISAATDAAYDLAASIEKAPDEPAFGRAGCAFLEAGALLIEEAGVWRHYSALEGQPIARTPVTPATLRDVPNTFQNDLDAVLQGVDGNTYLFKAQDCFNVLLNTAYPLAEEWGRAKNNIYLHNTVDAAFVGRDNRTYLFSGDQFFTYTGTAYVGAEIDGEPKCIAEHWGGLTSVALAYVKDQKTYLFETADRDGNFRYVCYSTPDYSRPDPGFPQTASMDFWRIPANYRAEGADALNAILVDGDNMFFINRDHYIQYNQKTDTWTYPRPLGRMWRDFPLDKLEFPSVKTAFIGADGTTYFFAEETYVARNKDHTFTNPEPIRKSWGLAHNNFVNNSNGNRVDAAFVYQNRITYLFSGDQYVRYSGQDYRYADAGYPKPLLGNLRLEAGFQNLPASFEDVLERNAGKTDPLIDAVVANGRNIYLLIGKQCYVVSQSAAAAYDLGIVGRVKNHLVDRNRVDAAFVGEPAHGYRPTFLFSGDQYVRYSTDDYTYVDDGYPRSIAAAFAGEMGGGALPKEFHDGLDAALYGADGSIYLFKGQQYLQWGEAAARDIREKWGIVFNEFAHSPARPIDAAFIAPHGGLYVFKGGQYARYQTPEQEFVDEGYPKAIDDNWGNLPAGFEQSIDGAFVFEDVTYLLKGADYVRYSDLRYQAIDSIYPQAFEYRWGAWADYLLSDVKTIARFKQLQEAYGTADASLAEFLDPPPVAIKTPYEQLEAIFGWDLDEIKWLKRRNGFLGGRHRFEEQFQLELIIKLDEIFATAHKIGAAPSDLFANVWQPLYVAKQPGQAAETLYRYLAQKQSEHDWQVLARQIHNELNLIKRDALMPVVIARRADIENARDLYARYLIDVEMGSSGVASRIQEAIAATQLYVHRYFVNLEEAHARGGAAKDEETRGELKRWWKWMKNYRVWEANRKVFLYPENYIRPELRDTKTPAFKTLEEDLLQGEITAATVQRAYKKYLDEYTEVSRLTIAGGYVYQASELAAADRSLVLFGRTKTDPRRYYYRMAEFVGDGETAALWTPWLAVNVQIDADKVYPVFAFARVFVFWARAEAVANAAPSTAITTTTSGTTQTVSSDAPKNYAINIYYSFYNLNKEWVPAQVLTADMPIPVGGKIDDLKAFNAGLKLFVENSDKLNIQGRQLDHENIVVNCAYSLNGAESNVAFYLTPELYAERADKPNFSNRGTELFQQIFDEPQITNAQSEQATSGQAKISLADVVMFNTLEKSTDGPWFSFDYKGGSFLCKPVQPPLGDDVWPNQLEGNKDGLPEWPRIDAAFATDDGASYFFNSAGKNYIVVESGKQTRDQPTRARWGHVANNIAKYGVVDAGLMVDDGPAFGKRAYLFSGDQYLTFSVGLDLADADCPKALHGNPEGLPDWPQIKAAFTGADGKTYVFNNRTQQFMALQYNSPTRQFAALETAKVAERWGKIRPASVAAAFSIGDYTYLAHGSRYVRYNGSAYDTPEAGYPQAFTKVADLAGLQNAKRASSIDPQKVATIFYGENTLYFQNKGEDQLQRLDPKGGQDSDQGEFRKYLSEDQLIAVTMKGSRIYAFKRKIVGAETVITFGVYNLELKDDDKGDDKNNNPKKEDKDDDRNKNPKKAVLKADDDGADKNKGDKDKDGNEGKRKGKWEYRTVAVLDGQGNKVAIDQALAGKDGKCYLFAGEQYMRSAEWAELIEKQGDDGRLIRWNPEPGTVTKDWLHIVSRIAETGLVDAALVRGNDTYLFSGDQYVRYSGKKYDFIEGYPQLIRENREDLPAWDQLDAVFKAADATFYFFDNHSNDKIYVESGQLDKHLATAPRWGIIRNNFTESSVVDAAFVRNKALYLTSGNQFVRYTLLDGKTPDRFVDAGYPKEIGFGASGIAQIDAAFTLGDYLYLFAGERYFKVAPSAELDSLQPPQFIQGNWGNLPYSLRSGLDAAFQRNKPGKQLFLFKAGQYARYSGDTALYEIIEARYDITRLTTSTAYKLNQRLFSGGVAALLNLVTQQSDELPSFSEDASTPTNIKVRPNKVGALPESMNLDFESANGIYYWEIFFHAPFLIAQALNSGQKFEEAKEWYEYIFDPTERAQHWKFLPFLAVDVRALLDACTSYINQLKSLGADPTAIETAFSSPVFARLVAFVQAFQQLNELSAADKEMLKDLDVLLSRVRDDLSKLAGPSGAAEGAAFHQVRASLYELVDELQNSYQRLGHHAAQIKVYLNDPFDPHAIAALRPSAYRKAIVMAYVDNLLDWGDMLFRQYTRESIDEARMLYILAYDLLGEKPENLGTRLLPPDTSYARLPDPSEDTYEPVLYLPGPKVVGDQVLVSTPGTPHASVANTYFFVPENSQFYDYWTRVEDRLYKIRHSLNILGISQPLPLFEPPIDPMALVQAAGSGAALGSALASLNIAVPHYHFSFMLRKAQDLAQKLAGFAGDLLGALEKKDAEELSLLQNRQEAVILSMTRDIKADQVKAAQETVAELEASLEGARNRESHYQGLIDEGLLPIEEAQIGLMISASVAHLVSSVLKIAASFGSASPDALIGPFIMGIKEGGANIGDSIRSASEVFESTGEGLSVVGEVLGIYASHMRMVQDWQLQLSMAQNDVIQIGHQLAGARLQQQIAQRELAIQEKEIEHNAAIKAFMQSKFSNAQLYQWMIGKLAGLYFQTYGMAYDMAKAAEKAFQFERGLKESEVSYIQPLYWDSQKKGLLAGASLGLDLDRMEKAYIDSNSRGFEITKQISLLELDPLALLQLKSKGVCDFSLTEALFDYDFPGHYCRQIKTVALAFVAPENQRLNVNATLTQLSHKTVLEPDAKAVKYLLDPKDQPPPTLRSDWRASQQIALSYVDEYEKNNGLFELRYDDDRYLPFEGTGAVATWRLELNGKKGAYNVNDLRDVTITLKYTAEPGGAVFGTAVKGMLKPYPTARFFDVAQEFPDAWQAFLEGEDDQLLLSLSRDMFPNMSGGKITSMFARYELAEPGDASMVLNNDKDLTLRDGKFLATGGLSIASRGSKWAFAFDGDKSWLTNIGLVLGYTARVV